MGISYFLRKKFAKSLFFPSHNRGKALPSNLIGLLKEEPGIWDLPELPDLGSPLSNFGIIKDSQDYISEKFNTKNCWFGVNGASGLIQSAILAMANPGDYILMPRNIHISVIKICLITNIIPIFFDLEYSEKTGQYIPLKEEWLKKILNDNLLKDIKIAGVILVNPTYQGYSANIKNLIHLFHDRQIPVLVDEAHGAYFLFCEDSGLPISAVRASADLVVHSLHKSLNGLTQTAILWHTGENVDENKILKSINYLQTTSPNSLLLASCEESILDWLETDNIKKYKKRIEEARYIFKELSMRGVPLIKSQDPLKIVLNTGSFGIDGFTADEFFCRNGIIAELPEMMTLTFCLGFSKHENFVDIFEDMWINLISSTYKKRKLNPRKPPFKLVQIPEVLPSKTLGKKSIRVHIKKAIGKISSDIICPYPPGIPLVVPGELIDKERVDWLIEQGLWGEDLLNFYIDVLNT